MIHRTAMMLTVQKDDKNDLNERYYRNIVIGQGTYAHQLLTFYYYLPLFSKTVQEECRMLLVEIMRDFYNGIVERYMVFIKELGNTINKITDEDLQDIMKNSSNDGYGCQEIFWNIFNAAVSLPIDIQSTVWMELSVKMMEFEAVIKTKYKHEIDKIGINFSFIAGDDMEVH